MDLLNKVFWNNSVSDWLIALGIIVFSLIFIKLFKYIVLNRVKIWSLKTVTTWDDFLIVVIEKSAVPILYASSIYAAFHYLVLPKKVEHIIHIAWLTVVSFFIIRIITSAFRKFVYSFINTQENSEVKKKQAGGLIVIVNVIIWILGIVFLIGNFGYDVTALVAGLGIGGIAIALAAQAILGDLFSYFVIFFDRPFEIGDLVNVDTKTGTIEHIGIKTTRIRSITGEQLICSNTDLTNARLHNFKRLERRRVVFKLGVTYQTKYKEVAEIPTIVKSIIEKIEKIDFDRGHFSGYGDFSLNFEFVYHVNDTEYVVYMDKQQEIYLAIFEAFENRGIEFAYPTQTLFLEKNEVEENLK